MIKRNSLSEMTLMTIIFTVCLLPVQGNDNTKLNEQDKGSYKFALIMISDNNSLPIPITNPVFTSAMLKNEIALYFKPISNAYFYVYIVNPGKTFKQIRPVAFINFKTLDYNYKSEYIPLTEELLPLSTDCWELHVLISTKQLPKIEVLISGLSKLEVNQTDKLTELTNKLNKEIASLKVKGILGNSLITLPEPVNHPFRTSEEDRKIYLDQNSKILYITDIQEDIYKYACSSEN